MEPSHTNGSYEFADLVALRVVASLLESGLPLSRIRRAVVYLREAKEELNELRLVTDGANVWACRDDGQILDALRHGQLALFVAVDQFVSALEADVRQFDSERDAFVHDLGATRSSGDPGVAPQVAP